MRVVVLQVVLVTLSEGLVMLFMSYAMLRAEPLRGLEQLIPLLAQPSDSHDI